MWDSRGWILYGSYMWSPIINIRLNSETKAEEILSVFLNFQQAISDQIEKNK